MIRTTDLWCRKRQLYQLSHNNCPFLAFLHCHPHKQKLKNPLHYIESMISDLFFIYFQCFVLQEQECSFFKMGQSRPLFVYFCYFLIIISIIQIEKSVDGMLGIRTRGRRMVGADETTELWRPQEGGMQFYNK